MRSSRLVKAQYSLFVFDPLPYRKEPIMARRKQKTVFTLIDFILVLLTGGLWLIWILIKFLRSI